jgi:hypothetical protein
MDGKIIISPKSKSKDGIIYEQDVCFLYDMDIKNYLLGNEIINTLNLYSLKDKNLTNTHESDWPAFKYSKSKSIKYFKEHYIRIEVSSVNNENLILKIEREIKNTNLCISSYISFHEKKDEIGERVREVYNVSLNDLENKI